MNIHPNFKQAMEASRNSDHPQHKMGAAIYYKNQFLAAGYNSLKTHPKTHYFDNAFTIHAEIHALLKAKANKFDLTNSSIYVYRATKNGELGMAYPCLMCLFHLKLEGIKEIFFTNYNGWEKIKI